MQRQISEKHHDALSRASSGMSTSNYLAIMQGFIEKGIPEDEIKLRENVLTFNAWIAKGRCVRKGEHGVRCLTYLPIPERKDEGGKVTRKAGRRPKTTTVFHVSQTDALG